MAQSQLIGWLDLDESTTPIHQQNAVLQLASRYPKQTPCPTCKEAMSQFNNLGDVCENDQCVNYVNMNIRYL